MKTFQYTWNYFMNRFLPWDFKPHSNLASGEHTMVELSPVGPCDGKDPCLFSHLRSCNDLHDQKGVTTTGQAPLEVCNLGLFTGSLLDVMQNILKTWSSTSLQVLKTTMTWIIESLHRPIPIQCYGSSLLLKAELISGIFVAAVLIGPLISEKTAVNGFGKASIHLDL